MYSNLSGFFLLPSFSLFVSPFPLVYYQLVCVLVLYWLMSTTVYCSIAILCCSNYLIFFVNSANISEYCSGEVLVCSNLILFLYCIVYLQQYCTQTSYWSSTCVLHCVLSDTEYYIISTVAYSILFMYCIYWLGLLSYCTTSCSPVIPYCTTSCSPGIPYCTTCKSCSPYCTVLHV